MELMTLKQKNKLRSNPRVEEYLERRRQYYLTIARRVKEQNPDLPNDIDRIDIVVQLIESFDADVYGLDGTGGMSVDEICGLFARSVVGHEDE